MYFEANEVVASIRSFKIEGWGDITAEDIILEPITNGLINITCKVTKKQGEGPKNLIIKKYGGNIHHEMTKSLFRINSPLIQALIFYEQSSRGWGPKLYGLMENGRVEEYIDCHTLKAVEAFEDEISVDMAQTFARFHSMDIPIDKSPYLTIDETIASLQHIDAIKTWIELTPPEPPVLRAIKSLLEFPTQQEFDWCKRMIARTRHRTTLCTLDANYLNRLVRNYPPEDPRSNRTVIIDFDISAYSHRGYDLGGHLVNAMLELSPGNVLSVTNYPGETSMKPFLQAYLEESAKLLSDFDGDSLDSLENLTLEVEIYSCVYLLWLILLAHVFCKTSEVTMYTFYEPSVETYKKLKRRICEKYPHLQKD